MGFNKLVAISEINGYQYAVPHGLLESQSGSGDRDRIALLQNDWSCRKLASIFAV